MGCWGAGLTGFALAFLPSALPPGLCQPWPLPDRPLGEIFSHALITSCLDHILSSGNRAGTAVWGFSHLVVAPPTSLPWGGACLPRPLHFPGSQTSSSNLSPANFPMCLEVTARPSLIGGACFCGNVWVCLGQQLLDFAGPSSDSPLCHSPEHSIIFLPTLTEFIVLSATSTTPPLCLM